MKSYAVTINATATRICPTAAEVSAGGSSSAGTASIPAGIHIGVPSAAAQSVFIGGPDVTTANGFELAAGASIEIDLASDAVYGIVAATTESVRVLRTS
jgi:hypothetical protein